MYQTLCKWIGQSGNPCYSTRQFHKTEELVEFIEKMKHTFDSINVYEVIEEPSGKITMEFVYLYNQGVQQKLDELTNTVVDLVASGVDGETAFEAALEE